MVGGFMTYSVERLQPDTQPSHEFSAIVDRDDDLVLCMGCCNPKESEMKYDKERM